jgi:hypothetical protein
MGFVSVMVVVTMLAVLPPLQEPLFAVFGVPRPCCPAPGESLLSAFLGRCHLKK